MPSPCPNRYPWLILLLLGSFLLFSGWSAYRASTRGSSVTDPAYYSKGLKYNDTLVEKQAASVLGWRLQTSLVGRQLQLRLRDAADQPVSAEANFFLGSDHRATPQPFPLVETSPGAYTLTLPPTWQGELQGRIELARAGARLNRQLLLNL